MKTTSRKAIDPATDQSYQIDLPALEEIRLAILNFDHPTEGIKIQETKEKFVVHFNLSDEQKAAKMRSSQGRYLDIFYYMVADAITSLVEKGKLHQPGGEGTPYFPVQEKDIEDREEQEEQEEQEEVAPTIEDIEDIHDKVHKGLAADLLDAIKKKPPEFFEKLVIDLLVQMGYGGSREDAEAVGRSGDGGIDGIINEDRLGLDVVYVQAKQWEGSVSRPEIQKFAGALQGQRARKGIFVTTSEFTKGCLEYVKSIDSKIILIDGQQLAQFMIEHDVGVSTTKTYEIKRVDSDYFAEE